MKNIHAQSLGRSGAKKRWEKTTLAQRKAFSRMMHEAKALKKAMGQGMKNSS